MGSEEEEVRLPRRPPVTTLESRGVWSPSPSSTTLPRFLPRPKSERRTKESTYESIREDQESWFGHLIISGCDKRKMSTPLRPGLFSLMRNFRCVDQ